MLYFGTDPESHITEDTVVYTIMVKGAGLTGNGWHPCRALALTGT